MERSTACAVSPGAQWRTLPLERKLHWILCRGGVGCFIGHSTYDLLTKEAWVPYVGSRIVPLPSPTIQDPLAV